MYGRATYFAEGDLMRKDWESRRYRVIWLNVGTGEKMVSGHDLTYAEAEMLIRQGHWAKDSCPSIQRVDSAKRKLQVMWK